MKACLSTAVWLLAAPIAQNSIAAEPTAPAPASTNASGPRIVFDSAVFDFGKVMAGESVTHGFVFTNT